MKPVFERLNALGIGPMSTEVTHVTPSATGDLLTKVRARAAEIARTIV
jgi:hypothetical protein